GIIKIIIADNFDQSMADYSLAVFGIGLKYLIPFMLLCLVCSASLADARAKREDAKRGIAGGIDPMEAKREEKIARETQLNNTFK
ncbi:integrase arm-type DNA-binding domain-containing protein, partial [Salmonella enterica subsp. enterica serovar Kentucky]|nr:integrase arm-type DNA-binding domain-containing protein [Salmonella enterica subsp. enterica serovar Kentucky]